MEHTAALIRRLSAGWARRLFLRLACAAAIAVVPSASALVSSGGDQRPTDLRRAQTPLHDIAGAEVPPAVTAVPLEQLPTVQAACDRARAQIDDGRFQEAIDTLTGVAEEPGADRYELHYLLALAQKGLGQLDAARASAEAAARLGHGVADVHYLLAAIYQRKGEIEPAIAHYRSATLAADRELNNVNVTLAWYYLGQTLAEAGYDLAAAEAYAHFDAAVWQTHPEQRNAGEIAAVLSGRPYGMVPERLRLLERLGRSAETVHVGEWAREIWPADGFVARLYAEALLSGGAPDQALAFCRAQWEDPATAKALLPVAVDAARAARQLDDWIDALAREVAEGRNLEQAVALVRCLNRVASPAQALLLGRALLAQRPNDGSLTWDVAAAHQATGDLRGALETLITFVRNNPDSAELPRRRLAAWTDWFDSGVDVGALIGELRRRPDADFAADFVLGAAALAAGESALADELLQSCIAARPDFEPAYVVQGEMLLATYQWDAAKAHASRVLKEKPGLAAADYVLAEAHDGLDENEPAEQAYKRAIQLRPDEPAYKLALARHYRRLGNWLGAQRYFQEALEDDPGNGEALEDLIDCYLRDGKVEIARAQLERVDQNAVPKDALRRINTLMRFLPAAFGPDHLAELKAQFEQYPDDLATARYLAGGLYQWRRLDEAYEIIQKARATDPDDYHLMSLLANVHADREEFDEAIALLEALAQRFPNRLTVLQPLVFAYLNDFRLEEGRAVLRRLIELDEDGRSRYRELLLRSYVEFRECDAALGVVEDWIAQEPKTEALVSRKIEVLLDCDRNDEAFALVERRLQDEPESGVRKAEFVEYGQHAKRYEEVAARVRKWLDDDPDDARLAGTLIDLLLKDDRADEALEVARKFEGTYDESIVRRIWLGRCQAARGETDTALAEFDFVLAERMVREEVRAEAREHLINTLINVERYDEALERCHQWLKLAAGLDREAAARLAVEALLHEAKTLQAARRDTEYAQVMEDLLSYLPGNSGFLNDLGYTWVDMGINVERATPMIRRAVAAEPWNAAFVDSLGWAYYKAGDFDNAHKYLVRATRLRDGQDPVVYDHLADAAYRLGDPKTAGQHWRKALSLIETSLNEHETPKPERRRLANLAEGVRAKLAALERSEAPALAPTAAEQHKE
jgi:tetratricopeptide (TPR) repeat protein